MLIWEVVWEEERSEFTRKVRCSFGLKPHKYPLYYGGEDNHLFLGGYKAFAVYLKDF